jgi:hypothetical protein
MSNFGIKISKEGENVFTADLKDLEFSSALDTLKIAKTGSITVALPDETVTSDTKVYTESYTHGLGYVPFFDPPMSRIEIDNYDTTDDHVCNDSLYFVPTLLGYGPSSEGESVKVYVSSTELTLEVTRTEVFGVGIDFGEHDIIFYYTIFYNRMDEEFNLLS